jgi:hypothetical protein
MVGVRSIAWGRRTAIAVTAVNLAVGGFAACIGDDPAVSPDRGDAATRSDALGDRAIGDVGSDAKVDAAGLPACLGLVGAVFCDGFDESDGSTDAAFVAWSLGAGPPLDLAGGGLSPPYCARATIPEAVDGGCTSSGVALIHRETLPASTSFRLSFALRLTQRNSPCGPTRLGGLAFGGTHQVYLHADGCAGDPNGVTMNVYYSGPGNPNTLVGSAKNWPINTWSTVSFEITAAANGSLPSLGVGVTGSSFSNPDGGPASLSIPPILGDSQVVQLQATCSPVPRGRQTVDFDDIALSAF